MKYQGVLAKIALFALLAAWVFSGWPQIFNFPPEIEKARAAFPQVASLTESTFASGTSHAVAMPATVAAGDLLLLLLTNDGSATVIDPDGAGGWTEIATIARSTYVRGSVWAKDAAGNEGGTTVDFVTSADEAVAAQVYRILAADWYGDITDGVAQANAGGGANSVDPPSLSPAWGSDETLWIAYLFKSSTNAVTAYPASYTNGANTNTGDTTANATAASARREVEAASEDPGAFTAGGSGSVFTIAVRPSAVSVPDAPTLYPDDGGSNQVAFNNTRQNDTTPIIRASATYTASFDRFQVEFNTASDFSGTAYTETFSGTYSSGTQYNLQTTGTLGLPTTNGVTYYVRARASADSGTNYGAWSSDTWTYTYKSSGDPDWFQTTDEQFDTGTLSSTQTSGSDSVEIGGGEIAKAGTDTTGTGNASPLEFSHTLVSGSNRIIICAAGIENSGDTSISATYGGQAMTEAVQEETGTSGYLIDAAIFYLLEAGLPSDGANTASFTFSGTLSSAEVNAWCGEYTGVSQGVPEATDPTIWSSGTTITNDISPSAGAWVFSAVGVGNAGTFTHGQNQQETYDANDASSGFATAELRGANGETSLDSTFSATINRGVRIAASWTGADGSSGTIMSPEIDFDWVTGQTTWGTAAFSTTETNGDVDLRVYYTVSTACDTIVPDGALSGNSTGFDVSASPVDISGLTPVASTYNRICLQATLTDSGGTPFLNDWTVSWAAAGGELTSDIVDDGGNPVSNPYLYMTTTTLDLTYQTATGTLGEANQNIRVSNQAAGAEWTLTIAASSSAAYWDGGSASYDFNDPTAGAGDGGDGDAIGGQMTIDPSGSTIAPEGGCSGTGLTRGSSSSFSEGVTNVITLLTAGATADTSCYWDIMDIDVSQTIPASQDAGSYSIKMTITVTAV